MKIKHRPAADPPEKEGNMKISKEIKDLLAKEEGEFKINEAFIIRRWTIKEGNELGLAEHDGLKVEMIPVNNGRRNFFSKDIESRDVQGIIEEVAKAMEEIMEEYTTQLVNRWNGGLV